MKKALIVLAVTAIAVPALAAKPAPIYTDNFDGYADGTTLAGNGDWTLENGKAREYAPVIQSGAVKYAPAGQEPDNVWLKLGTGGANVHGALSTYIMEFDLTIDDLSAFGNNPKPKIFGNLKGSFGDGQVNLSVQFVENAITGNTMELGLYDATDQDYAWSGLTFKAGDTVTVAFGHVDNEASLWLNKDFSVDTPDATNSSSLYDASTGFMSASWGPGPAYTMDNLAIYDVVPEPATMSLLGLGGLAVLRRRRRK
ncbi:MAG: PEP-CTERM sorting domain-containing protein [Phycisphaerae bacterium]